MSSSLNKYVSKTIVLTNGATGSGSYQAPLTIAAGAGVKITSVSSTVAKNGVYDSQVSGASGYTLTNNGGIFAGSSRYYNGGIGVDMTVSANVLNSGKIYGGKASYSGTVGGTGEVMTGGTLKNSSTGHIQGGYGDYSAIGGTGVVENGSVINYGTIAGGAAFYKTTKGSTGVLLNGGVLTNKGTIDGGYYSTGTGGTGTRTYEGVGVQVSAGTTLTNSGIVYGGAIGVNIVGGTVVNSGTISSYKGTSHTTAVNFGSVSGGKLELEVANSNGVSSAGINGTIAGFVKGDTVQIANMTVGQVTAAFNTTTDTLSDNGNITFVPVAVGEQFSFTADANGGTDITTTACYRVGTRIRTSSGDRPIEELAIGDMLITVSGVARPIRWIGQLRYTQFFAAGNRDVLPIKICAGALNENVPTQDLWVSPEHAMMIDGMLIPARSLVNGLTIWQDETPRDVTYMHVEFDSHDLIYAEGAISESYVDDNTRAMFDNADDFKLRYPGAFSVAAVLCAPRVEEGDCVEEVRDRLKVRAEQVLGLPQSSVLLADVSRSRADSAAFSLVRA